jgi:hypothetical protein
MNYAVWDVKHGTLLKLTKGRRVSHAIRGFEKLSDLTIRELYGEPPMFESFGWISTGKKLQDAQRDRPYWVMMGYSDCYKIPVICQIVAMILNGTVKKSFIDFAYDLSELDSTALSPHKENQAPTYEAMGRYYTPIMNDPLTFIQPQTELLNVLMELRYNG